MWIMWDIFCVLAKASQMALVRCIACFFLSSNGIKELYTCICYLGDDRIWSGFMSGVFRLCTQMVVVRTDSSWL